MSPPHATPAPPGRGYPRFSAVLAGIWLLLLLLAPGWHSLQQRSMAHSRLERELGDRQRTLDQLRAVSVGAKMEGRESHALVEEFAALTGLRASDPFRGPQGEEPASIQIAALVRAVQEASPTPSEAQNSSAITLISVTPGARVRLGPFLMTEFELNLEGRFRQIPAFLDLLTQIGRNRRLAISVGSLHLTARPETQQTGVLTITLPVRAYFRE